MQTMLEVELEVASKIQERARESWKLLLAQPQALPATFSANLVSLSCADLRVHAEDYCWAVMISKDTLRSKTFLAAYWSFPKTHRIDASP